MVNHKVDDAIAIFRFLSGSSDPAVASQSSQTLAQAVSFRERTTPSPEDRLKSSIGQSTRALRETADHQTDQEAVAAPVQVSAPVRFLKGRLVSVDCSSAPQALLTVATGPKSFKLQIRDRVHVILLGADAFSCDWKGKNIAVNYREGSGGDGDVVSVEIQ